MTLTYLLRKDMIIDSVDRELQMLLNSQPTVSEVAVVELSHRW
jgi:hypothetical protein